MDISVIDLLYLTLAVIGYATGATLWTYFSRPAQAREGQLPLVGAARPATVSGAVAEFFDDGKSEEPAWPEVPGRR